MVPSTTSVPPKEPIKLLFVVAALYTGGAERHLLQILPRLDPERFAPKVVCIKEPGNLYLEFEEAGIPAVVLGHGKRREARALSALVRLMRDERPDVVVTWGFAAEAISRVAAYIARVPARVVWKHNCGHVSRRLRERIADRVLDRITDFYLGVAFGQVRYLVDDLGLPGHKVRVVRLGVPPDRFWPPPPPDASERLRSSLGIADHERVVSMIAVLRPEKDHATFLRAGRLLIDRMPDARLLVVGGPPDPELERLAAEIGLGDRVIFTGMRKDIHELLGITDVIVLSSYTVECFPVSILEAYSAGVPSVCTAIGGLPELVDHGVTGYLVPPRDPRALSDGIARILEVDGRAGDMGRAARRRFEERFTLDVCVEESERVFADIADATRKRERHPA